MSRQSHSELRVHIGAHKTATTHLQDTLSAMRNDLTALGVTYVPRDVVRSSFLRALAYPGASWKYRLLAELSKNGLSRIHLFPALRPRGIFLVSEENILGNTVDLLSVDPYPYLGRNVEFLHHLSQNFPLTIFLSIRSFDQVYPGAYATALRFLPNAAKNARDALQQQLQLGKLPSWATLMERIQTALPNATIRLWTQDSYRNCASKIIENFVGIAALSIPQIPPPDTTATPSGEAIKEIEASIESFTGSASEWLRYCNRTYDAFKVRDRTNKYTFLTTDVARRLRTAYETDLENLTLRWPEALVR